MHFPAKYYRCEWSDSLLELETKGHDKHFRGVECTTVELPSLRERTPRRWDGLTFNPVADWMKSTTVLANENIFSTEVRLHDFNPIYKKSDVFNNGDFRVFATLVTNKKTKNNITYFSFLHFLKVTQASKNYVYPLQDSVYSHDDILCAQ